MLLDDWLTERELTTYKAAHGCLKDKNAPPFAHGMAVMIQEFACELAKARRNLLRRDVLKLATDQARAEFIRPRSDLGRLLPNVRR